MNGLAVMENVRRYRTIALLYRQTAAFRPLQRCSLLEQAEAWQRRALAELETYFLGCDAATLSPQLSTAAQWPAMLH
jgi:hypothetical protein